MGLLAGSYYDISAAYTLGSSFYTTTVQPYVYGGGQISGGSFGTLTVTHEPEEDEDDRSENEQWLDGRVDEMRVKL